MRFLPEKHQSLHINRPTLLIDKKKIIQNIESMRSKADTAGVIFRPHFKTHQSAEIGQWFRDRGVGAITVSSLDMAQYFADNGWTDITVAFPVNLLEISKINSLAETITLNLLVDSEHTLQVLDESLDHTVKMWVKIDVGYPRTGISWEEIEKVVTIVEKIKKSRKINFAGILAHSGHSYEAKSTEEIRLIHSQSIVRLIKVKYELEKREVDSCNISIGDTPCCSIADSFDGVDEIRPGNFVFYDLKQEDLGSCSAEDIAVVVACPVISKNRERKQIIVYGGAVHFSKDFITDANNRKVYGYIAACNDDTWTHIEKRAPVISLSQEHGVIQVDDDIFNRISIGDLLFVYPVHSCLTCDLYKEYKTIEGDIIRRKQSNSQLI
jgi:D-serine deaminase-like pyridoxal phosphate-dependent protein